MASISTDRQGNRRILFYDAEGNRPVIHLGKLALRKAEGIKRHVEELVSAQFSGEPIKQDTAAWVADVLREPLRSKLVKVGLLAERPVVAALNLAAFLDQYIESRSDAQPSTVTVYGHTRRCLVDYFGADKPLERITQGDADEWRRHLARPKAADKDANGGEGLADNTVRRRCAIAKQFFRAAVRKRLIAENPFGDMKGIAIRENRTRDFFVTREMAALIFEACPDTDWRVIFALSRYGGLRCPSETLELRWGDIDWEHNRMTVRSPKTAHHEGGESRTVPLFPELRKHLDDAYELAEEAGSPFVVTRYRDATQNLRTTLEKIVRRAGLEPWPKLFQNLRASRATELVEDYPGHVAADWLGHTEAIANKHYRQVTGDHFAKAVCGNFEPTRAPTRASSPQAQAGKGGESHEDSPAQEKPPYLPVSATSGELMQIGGMGGTGLEPVTSTV